jgi:hypothetical protein
MLLPPQPPKKKTPKKSTTKTKTKNALLIVVSFRGPHVRLALLTELPSLNKEFIVIIIIKGDNHSTV